MSLRPALLVIAGHDPSPGQVAGTSEGSENQALGYAGLRADSEGADECARLAGELPLHLLQVATAWTDQDSQRVRSIGAREPAQWLTDARDQSASAVKAGGLVAVKFGLLPGPAHVRAAAELVRELRDQSPRLPVVLDPVLASSSGTVFLNEEARALLLSELIPLGITLTPNLPEARELAAGGSASHSGGRNSRLRDGQALMARGARSLVIKGGHAAEDPLLNLVLERGQDPVWLSQPRLPGTMRGTGCRFASALAAGLGLGLALVQASRLAGESVANLWTAGS